MLVSIDVKVWLSCVFFFFKQKTAYEMRISDWSSDVCSSDFATGRLSFSEESAARDKTLAIHALRVCPCADAMRSISAISSSFNRRLTIIHTAPCRGTTYANVLHWCHVAYPAIPKL